MNQNRACDAISWQIKTKTKKISKKDLFDYNFSILVPCLALDPTDDALEMKLINPATGLEVPNTRFLDFKTGFEIFDAEYNFHNGKVECVATYRNRTDSASFYLIFEFSNQWQVSTIVFQKFTVLRVISTLHCEWRMMKNLLTEKNISSNQLFNFFSKSIIFTKFLPNFA